MEELLAIVLIIAVFTGLFFGIFYLLSIPDVNIFNKEYGTSYTTIQWMCGSDTIKEIIQGTKHNINIREE